MILSFEELVLLSIELSRNMSRTRILILFLLYLLVSFLLSSLIFICVLNLIKHKIIFKFMSCESSGHWRKRGRLWCNLKRIFYFSYQSFIYLFIFHSGFLVGFKEAQFCFFKILFSFILGNKAVLFMWAEWSK